MFINALFLLLCFLDSSPHKQSQAHHGTTASPHAITAALFAPSGTVHSILKRFSAQEDVSELISNASRGQIRIHPTVTIRPPKLTLPYSLIFLRPQKRSWRQIGRTTEVVAVAVTVALWTTETCAPELSSRLIMKAPCASSSGPNSSFDSDPFVDFRSINIKSYYPPTL